MEKNHYIDGEEFEQEVVRCQQNGNIVSERLGEMLLLMHMRILTKRNFQGYSQDLKEEMLSHSLQRIVRSIGKYDPSRHSAWQYFSRAAVMNYIEVIRKHYRRERNQQKFEDFVTEKASKSQKMNGLPMV